MSIKEGEADVYEQDKEQDDAPVYSIFHPRKKDQRRKRVQIGGKNKESSKVVGGDVSLLIRSSHLIQTTYLKCWRLDR